jgi:YspA, cpYpsA-related SLOG family
MRVLVCGGLDYTDRAELYAELDRLHSEYAFEMLIVGGVSDVDTLAVEWARVRGIATQMFTAPEWGTLRRTAGQLRNARILAECRPDS